MPPKLSKAERERIKREEAERKAREEEEQRAREEEERLAREEQERKEREEKEKLKAEEEARFLEETNNLNKVLEGQREELEKWKEEQQQKIQWQHYLSCSDVPDPSDEKATNTYLTLCQEDSITGNIRHTLNKINQWLNLYNKVDRWLQGDGLPSPSNDKAQHYKQVMSRIHLLIQSKLDADTLHYLQEPEKYTDSETYNLRVEDSLAKHQLTFCLWGNVVKDPRMKEFSFKEHLQFTLELPKPLLLADAAIRVLQLPFDDLSPQCHSYHCKKSPPSTGISTQSGSEPATDGEAPGDQVEEEEAAGIHDNKEGGSEGGGEGRKESVTSKPDQSSEAGVDDASGGSSVGGGGASEEVTSVVAMENEAAATASQKSGQQQGKEEASQAPESVDGNDEVNLRGFLPAGGPIIFQLLEMPPQARSVNNWTIRKVVPTTLPSYPYPPVVKRQPSPADGDGETNNRSNPMPGSAMWPPIGITMQLPQNYLFGEQPQLARWDQEAKVWRTGGFEDVLFDLEDKTVAFKTFYFSPLAIMVDRYVNMPYQSWEMLPLGTNHTRLNIAGAKVEISIDIREHVSTLLGPEEVPALAHLINMPLTARELMQGLLRAGANFFPELDADDFVSVTSKRPIVELSVYQSMSLASSGFAFQWSRWNGEVSRGKVVLRVAQPTSMAVTSGESLSWTTYLAGRKSYKLKVTEDSDEFSIDMQDHCETHPGLFAALEHEALSEAKARMRNTSPMHIEAIKLWLDCSKIITFS